MAEIRRPLPLLPLAAALVLSVRAGALVAQEADAGRVTLERIHATSDFRGETFGPARWLADGSGYTTVEAADGEGGGRDIVRYDPATGEREVMVPAAALTPEGAEEPLAVRSYEWSPDDRLLLVYTNSRRVWRQNTRGDYWVLDRTDGRLWQLGGDAKPSTLMFAKFDPPGERVAYVRENDLYVEDLRDGGITRLTTDGSRTIINGTFDWVYEEEFSLRDGFRWSPDGKRIAYWQLDAEGVRDYPLFNDTDSVYAFVRPVQYPKTGTTNSAARVGVVGVDGGPTLWLDVPGDPRENYIARMEWSGNSDEIAIQRMNRAQNTNRLMLGDADTGEMRTVLTETDEAWLDVVDDWRWLDGGKRFTWVSEKDGWRHVYVVRRDGSSERLITPGEYDVIQVAQIDEDGGWLYFIASPDDPTQRYLYRTRLNGRGHAERLTPADEPGVHGYTMAPGARRAFHTYSSFGTPPVTELVELPSHRVARVLVANERLKKTVAALDRGEAGFFRVNVGDIELDAWMMKPPDFDPHRKYPILFYGYGEPAGQTVMDRWGGGRYLWHLMLTQRGYIVASIDNRGTPSPRGRAFRKAIYRKIGIVNTRDQAAAAAEIVKWPYVDASRVATWGWSGGGEMALNLIFRYPDLYGTAMAVAPVAHYKFYDTIYTERYMGLLPENREAYDEAAALTHAANLRGNLLIVHGTGDDNVHFQNTASIVNALIEANRPFTMMAYPNRSHGIFEGKNTRRHLFELLTRYLAEHVPAGGRDIGTS